MKLVSILIIPVLLSFNTNGSHFVSINKKNAKKITFETGSSFDVKTSSCDYKIKGNGSFNWINYDNTKVYLNPDSSSNIVEKCVKLLDEIDMSNHIVTHLPNVIVSFVISEKGDVLKYGFARQDISDFLNEEVVLILQQLVKEQFSSSKIKNEKIASLVTISYIFPLKKYELINYN